MSTLYQTEHSPKIFFSLNRYSFLTPLAAVQPYRPHTCRLHSPNQSISFTRNMRVEGEVSSTSPLHPALHPRAHSLRRPQPPTLASPQRWHKNFPFLSPTLALSPFSFTMESSCGCPLHSSISTVCVSRTDGQFPLLTVLSRDWNVD